MVKPGKAPPLTSHTDKLDAAVLSHIEVAKKIIETGRLRRAEKKKDLTTANAPIGKPT